MQKKKKICNEFKWKQLKIQSFNITHTIMFWFLIECSWVALAVLWHECIWILRRHVERRYKGKKWTTTKIIITNNTYKLSVVYYGHAVYFVVSFFFCLCIDVFSWSRELAAIKDITDRKYGLVNFINHLCSEERTRKAYQLSCKRKLNLKKKNQQI